MKVGGLYEMDFITDIVCIDWMFNGDGGTKMYANFEEL